MFKVSNGQDPYSAIGKYIRDHITAIEDIIAVIEIDGVETNQLFMVNMNEDGYFIWKSDWYEGENDIVLIDFFPVSEAKKSSAEPERKHGRWIYGEKALFVGNPYGHYTCSCCGWKVAHGTSFCPHCGSDMRGEQE